MKKLLSIFRAFAIGIIWTYVFLVAANFVMYKLWSFNFMSARSWQTISRFWEAGGVIKTTRDYIFLLMLVSLPFLWLWGWRKLLRIDYLDILLYPLNAYNRHIINKYGHDSSRIVLRNLKSSQKMIEEIKSRLDSIKPAKAKEGGNIRAEVHKKLEEINKTANPGK